jgi:hypothetical protein
MSIGKLDLISTYFRVKLYNFKEQVIVALKYYCNIRFLLCDTMFFLLYLLFNPYRISRKFLEKRGEENIYVYGETPLITFAKILKHIKITSSDVFVEIGAGRGRSSIFASIFYPCHVIAVEWIPFFVKLAKLIKVSLFLKKVSFLEENIYQSNLSQSTIIYLYGTCMSENEVLLLINKFSTLKKGTKIITVSFSLNEYKEGFVIIDKTIKSSFPWGEANVYIQSII